MTRFLLAVFLFAAATFSGCRCASAQSDDNFADRLTLTGSAPVAVSNLLHATRETGEAAHAGVGVGRSIWYTWTAPATGPVNVGTYSTRKGSPPLRAVAVYMGSSFGTFSEVASSNNQLQSSYVQYYYGSPATVDTVVNFTATAGTVYQIAVDALRGDYVDDGTTILTINAPPTILSAANVTGITGSSFAYTVNASAGATDFAASGLPVGLAINTVTGAITGTPAAAGTSAVSLSATGPGGTGTATLTIRVTDPVPTAPTVPVIASALSARAYVGVAFSFSLYASGNLTAYTASGLPDGLTLNASTGAITGTPTATGSYPVPVSVTGPGGTGVGILTIRVETPPLPIITSALTAQGTTGSSLNGYVYTNLDGINGLAPTSYSVSNLPPGLTRNSATSSTAFSGTPTQAGVYAVPVSVTNVAGTRQAVITITISDPVATTPTPTPPPAATGAPTLVSLAWANGVVGTAFYYTLAASNTPTGYGASDLPPGIAFDAASGKFSGAPTAAGTFLVPVTATNAYGTSSGTLTITVHASAAAQSAAQGNPLPVVTSPASAVGYVGQTFSYAINALYPNTTYTYPVSGSNWTFSASGLPPGLSVTGNSSIYGTGTISGAPTVAGVYPATITVTCPANPYYNGNPVHPAATGTAVVTFTVSANAVGVAPVITGRAAVAATVGSGASYSPAATNSPTGYAASGLPPGMSLNATTGTVSGTPTTAGTYPATISATNATGTGTATVTFFVNAQTGVPFINASANSTGTLGQSFSYTVSASGSPTNYGASNLPPGLSLDTATGVLSGTPTAAGTYTVPVSATNGNGTANATVTLTITAPASNLPPTFVNRAVTTGTVGVNFNYSLYADQGPTSYGASNVPPGLSLNASQGYFSGTPTQAGTFVVPVSATNGFGTGTATMTFIIAAQPLPTFNSPCALAATVGQSFSSSVSADYADSYTSSGLPPGIVQYSAASGGFNGTPTQAGTYTVPVTATNAAGTTSAKLTIIVAPALTVVPTITSALGATAYVNLPFRYTFQADSSAVFYAASGLPAGLSFNTATRTISGQPTTAGSYAVALSASNSAGPGRATLTLAVLAGAVAPPVITSPSMIIVAPRLPFYHRITTDSPVTAYAATGLPPGMSLDTASGLISGTPTTTGTYPVPVTVTGSAGQGQATLTLIVGNFPSAIFTHPAVFNPIAGQPFSGTLTTSATGNNNATASPLPVGLSINSATGVISGTASVPSTRLASTSMYTDAGYISGKLLTLATSATPTVPVITSPAGIGTSMGLTFLYPLQATNSPTSFGASGLPPGLTLDARTGWISGATSDYGTYEASVTATNAQGTSAAATIVFTVLLPNSIPTQINSAAQVTGVVSAPFSYAVTANNNQNYQYVSGSSNLPPGLSVNPYSGLVTGTPTLAGTYKSTFTVRNTTSTDGTGTVTFNILTAGNAAPTFTSAAGATATVGSVFSYTVAANNGPTSYTAAGLPPGLSFNSATQVISGTPTTTGTYTVSLGAANAVGAGTGTLTLLVVPTALPTLTDSGNGLNRAANVGDQATTSPIWRINATGAPTSYAASGLPPGLSLDTATGQFSGTLTTVGTYPTTVSATNAAGTASAVITYIVSTPTPAPPVITGLVCSLVGFAGTPISTVSLSATNAPTAYAASGLPTGLTLNTSTGQITGTPTQAGTSTVNFSATNAAGTSTAVWMVIVKDPSALTLVLSSWPAQLSGTVGTTTDYYFNAYAYYAGNTISTAVPVTVSGLPAGVQVRSTGTNSVEIYGVPTTVGSYPLTINAAIPGGAAGTGYCTLVVQPPAALTVTSAAGALGNAGSRFSYSLSGGSGTTSYGAGTLPAGLSLNTSTGAITGTPTATGTFAVPVSVTGPYSTGTATVTIRIDPPLYGGLPVITSAATVSSQETSVSFGGYSYGASTAVSYTLAALNGPSTWTASNVPAGMVFNPFTGILAGQPTAVGTFLVPVSATNAAGTVNATLTVISSAYLAVPHVALDSSATAGALYSSQINFDYPALGFTTYVAPSLYLNPSASSPGPVAFTAVGLPPGLSINSYSGVLGGTPTVVGTFPVTITTTDRAGSRSAVWTLLVTATAPVVSPVTPTAPVFNSSYAQAAGFVGVPMSYSLYASGSPVFAATGLPSGVSLNAANGTISGSPTAVGTWPVAITATNSAGTAQATLTVTVDAAPLVPALSSACAVNVTVGVAFGYSLNTTNYSGEPTPTAYAASGLPAGLTLSTATGYVSGTPTGPAGTYSVPVTVSVGPAAAASGVLTIFVQPAPAPTTPLLGSPAGALGLVGNPFYYVVSSSAFAPTTTLPAGLTYNAAKGTISGYPTTPGTSVVAMAASDGSATLARSEPTGRRLPTTDPEENGTVTAALTIRVLNPQHSLPRLTVLPVGGSGMEGDAFALGGAAVGVPDPVFQWSHNGTPIAGATGPGLAFGSLQIADTGSYVLTVSNASGSVASPAVSLLVQTVYARWQTDHFTAAEIAGGLADDAYSFSGDGVSNLLKYALGLGPRNNAAGSALPAVLPPGADGLLGISFVRDASRSDLVYLVESSVDLSVWTTIAESDAGAAFGNVGAASVVEAAMAGTSRYQVTIRATPPPGGGQFLRMRIVRP